MVKLEEILELIELRDKGFLSDEISIYIVNEFNERIDSFHYDAQVTNDKIRKFIGTHKNYKVVKIYSDVVEVDCGEYIEITILIREEKF